MPLLPTPETQFINFMRAFLALGLTAVLPLMLWLDISADSNALQAYQDALAAAVAFYFGATSTPA